MARGDGFGFDPEDLDRVFREVGDSIRGALGGLGRAGGPGWSALFDDTRARAAAPEPATTGEQGDGVWVIHVVTDGVARVEQVFASELDALRANQGNTDAGRRVRFLPYGMPVTVLDPT